MKRQAMAWAAAALLAASGARAQWEARVLARLDPDDSEESQLGGLAGLGLEVGEGLTVGAYLSAQTVDRDLPRKMSEMYGYGLFLEYDLSYGYDLMPFVGLSAGILDTTGPSNPTAFHTVGTLGLKYALSPVLDLSGSANLHWADEDLFDYEKQSVVEWDADPTDLTFDVGVRFKF